jgi:uncharacterized membrane protein
VLDPAAPGAFVLTLVGTVVAFTLAWAYLMIRRYQLARLEVERERRIQLRRLAAARAARPPMGAPAEPAR